jgi:hypothetical protein
VVILAPKREGKGPKTPLTSSSSTKRPVTKRNPDHEPVAVVLDPEKLLRKPKVVSRHSSLPKGKLSSEIFQGQSSNLLQHLHITLKMLKQVPGKR